MNVLLAVMLLRKLIPQTLFARLALLLFMSLVSAQALGIWLLLTDRAKHMLLTQQQNVVNRMLNISQRMDRARYERLHDMSLRFSAPAFRVAVVERVLDDQSSDEVQAHPQLRQLEKLLQAGAESRRQWRVSVVDETTARNAGLAIQKDAAPPVSVYAKLEKGNWARFLFYMPQPPIPATRVLVSMAVMLCAILAVSFFAVRKLIGPLQTLANQARHIGNDLYRPPLKESGSREVRGAIKAVNDMQRRLIQLTEERSRMVSAMSHDLKTPISRMMLRAAFVNNPDLEAKFDRDLKEMQLMIDEALAFFSADVHAESAAEVDLRALMVELANEFNEHQAVVTLSKLDKLSVRGKRGLLKRCISNLISNGVKYGGSVSLSLRGNNSGAEICITDNGNGMSEEELARAFDPFWRAQSQQAHAVTGHGLGLSICRFIARAHQGDVTLVNSKQGGLCAKLSLPLSVVSGHISSTSIKSS